MNETGKRGSDIQAVVKREMRGGTGTGCESSDQAIGNEVQWGIVDGFRGQEQDLMD